MNKLEKSEKKSLSNKGIEKKKYSKQEKEFLTQYAITNNKQKAMEIAGLNVNKRTGLIYTDQQINKRSWDLLSTPFAQEYVLNMQKEILKKNCLSLEKAVLEAYDNYQMLKEKNSFHECNIAYIHYCNLAGYMRNNPIIQQQIVSSSNQPVQIVYNIPDNKLENN